MSDTHATQLSPEASARREPGRASRRRGRRIGVLVTGIAILLGGGYAIAVGTVPIAEPKLALDIPTTAEFAADAAAAQAVVDGQALPTAIGWLHEDDVWTNDPTPYPLASLSKLITVLVCQEQEPLEAGTDGPAHVWTAEDAALQDEYLAADGVAYPIPVGTEVTLRQMLTLIFLPSANDFAAAYAYSTFGDNDGYVAAVNTWKKKHGLDSLTMVEPTGMDEGNTANAADMLRIGRLVLENPVLAEFTRTKTAELPWGIGTVENSNPLLGEVTGILGVKTGRSSSAGFNYVAAQEVEVDGRTIVKMTSNLGRPSKDARAQSGAEMLEAIDALPQTVTLVEKDAQIGTATTADGQHIPLVAAASASTLLLPGEHAESTVKVDAAGELQAGDEVGSIRITTPSGEQQVAVVTSVDIVQPDYWWRFTHPAAVFGRG